MAALWKSFQMNIATGAKKSGYVSSVKGKDTFEQLCNYEI